LFVLIQQNVFLVLLFIFTLLFSYWLLSRVSEQLYKKTTYTERLAVAKISQAYYDQQNIHLSLFIDYQITKWKASTARSCQAYACCIYCGI